MEPIAADQHEQDGQGDRVPSGERLGPSTSTDHRSRPTETTSRASSHSGPSPPSVPRADPVEPREGGNDEQDQLAAATAEAAAATIANTRARTSHGAGPGRQPRPAPRRRAPEDHGRPTSCGRCRRDRRGAATALRIAAAGRPPPQAAPCRPASRATPLSPIAARAAGPASDEQQAGHDQDDSHDRPSPREISRPQPRPDQSARQTRRSQSPPARLGRRCRRRPRPRSVRAATRAHDETAGTAASGSGADPARCRKTLLSASAGPTPGKPARPRPMAEHPAVRLDHARGGPNGADRRANSQRLSCRCSITNALGLEPARYFRASAPHTTSAIVVWASYPGPTILHLGPHPSRQLCRCAPSSRRRCPHPAPRRSRRSWVRTRRP